MFDFLFMSDNYDVRKVARFESDNLIVSTARVFDSSQPFETGISHPAYNDGKFIIVELYNDIKEAKEGHKKWVKTMETLPPQLTDVSTSQIAQLRNVISGKTERMYTKS